MDLSRCANPEVFVHSFTRGTHNDTPLRCWPLSRRSGCFPALPCPPPRPNAFETKTDPAPCGWTKQSLDNFYIAGGKDPNYVELFQCLDFARRALSDHSRG